MASSEMPQQDVSDNRKVDTPFEDSRRATQSQSSEMATEPQAQQQGQESYSCGRKPLVRVLPRPSFKDYWAMVLQVSAQSIRLMVDRSFDTGTLVAIQLQRKFIGMSGILTAKILKAWVAEDPTEKGRWLLDCSLSRSLTDDEIITLLEGDQIQ